MLRRVAFGRYEIVRPPPAPLVPVERAGTYAGSTCRPAPKSRAQRNRRLLTLAEGKPCLLIVPSQCNHRLDTTVACHSNQACHGKAGRRKADDHWSCWGCSACHWWLDFGPAPQEQKLAVFDAGMERQIAAWKLLLAALSEIGAAEAAAIRWALTRHGAIGI